MARVAVIGKDGRTSAITALFSKSPRLEGTVRCLSSWKDRPPEEARREVMREARAFRPDLVFVGPEDPLVAGIVDDLQREAIACIGPTRSLAKLEASKAFTRELISRHGIPGSPEYRIFRTLEGFDDYLRRLDGFVVKPDGLTGGKGVKVSGTHLTSVGDAHQYAEELLRSAHAAVVIEEKLDGEEFSLQSFCDGLHVVDMPVVQDHKRAFEGDAGPNTGGMGSYSCEDHRLPFLPEEALRAASAINAAVAQALFDETGERYKGILYGGFMLTRDGVRLLEYNARFGDPEALNVLSLLETDFVEVCDAIVRGTLNDTRVEFSRHATVCKYIVPEGYPDHPMKDRRIQLEGVPKESPRLRWYLAAVDRRADGLFLTGSRAVAFVGIGRTLDEAETIAEEAASAVDGPVYHRRDIGTRALVDLRCEHVRTFTAR